MRARIPFLRQTPGVAAGLLLAALALLGGCGTGGSNDRASQPQGNAADPPGIGAPATPPEPSEDATGEPASAAADRQEKGDAAGSGSLIYPTQVPQPATPSRPRPASPAAPVERRIAKKSEVYDPAGSHFDLLQAPREALRDLPIDPGGRVDWVQALDQGLIAPRASRTGAGSMQVFDQDIIMKNTREMPWVRFPHRQHTEWLACSNCHPRPFAERAGANPVSMDAIFRGRYCGMCHDRVAFSVYVCERCHTEPHAGAPARWW